MLATIEAAYRDADAVAKRLAAEGARVIRTIGSDVPFTFLRAAGFAPVRLDPAPAGPTPRADAVMGVATGRTRAHRLMERLLDPAMADTPILLTRADAEQPQLFAALRERQRLGEAAPRHVHLLDLVHQPGEAATRYNVARLERLGEWLTGLDGLNVDDTRLAAAAEIEDATTRLIAAANGLRTGDTPRLSGTHLLHIIGCTAILPPAELSEMLRSLLADTDMLPTQTGRRTFVSGSAHEHDVFYRAASEQGLLIVGENHDWGERRLSQSAPRTLAEAAAPTRHVPLAAQMPRSGAQTSADRAIARRAEQLLHLAIDGDEAAPWTVAPIERALAGRLPLTAIRLAAGETDLTPAQSAPAARPKPPAAKAGAASRSRKSLSSVATFGAYQREWFADLRARVAAGAPFAMVNANAPQEILRALDIPFVVNQWWASIVAAKQQTRRYRALLRAHGYPTDVEAYSAQGLAAAFDDDADEAPWGGLPRPDFVHAVESSDATTGIFDAWAYETDAASHIYARTVDPRPEIATHWWEDLPDRWDEALEAERLDLLVAELRQVIGTLEQATGRAFSQDRFVEVMDLVNEQEDHYRRTRDLIARTVPAPIGIVDSMPATMVPQWHRGTEWARDAARDFHDEVATRVATGAAAVPNERVRLMWVGRGLWSDMGFYQQWEESHGAVFVWSMYLALAADGYIRRFDRGRDPLRALAARFLTMGDELRMPSWAGPWHVHEAQTHQVDGAVALSDADPFVLRALTAAGVPVLDLGVDNFALDGAEADALARHVTDFIEGPAGAKAAARRAS